MRHVYIIKNNTLKDVNGNYKHISRNNNTYTIGDSDNKYIRPNEYIKGYRSNECLLTNVVSDADKSILTNDGIVAVEINNNIYIYDIANSSNLYEKEFNAIYNLPNASEAVDILNKAANTDTAHIIGVKVVNNRIVGLFSNSYISNGTLYYTIDFPLYINNEYNVCNTGEYYIENYTTLADKPKLYIERYSLAIKPYYIFEFDTDNVIDITVDISDDDLLFVQLTPKVYILVFNNISIVDMEHYSEFIIPFNANSEKPTVMRVI